MIARNSPDTAHPRPKQVAKDTSYLEVPSEDRITSIPSGRCDPQGKKMLSQTSRRSGRHTSRMHVNRVPWHLEVKVVGAYVAFCYTSRCYSAVGVRKSSREVNQVKRNLDTAVRDENARLDLISSALPSTIHRQSNISSYSPDSSLLTVTLDDDNKTCQNIEAHSLTNRAEKTAWNPTTNTTTWRSAESLAYDTVRMV